MTSHMQYMIYLSVVLNVCLFILTVTAGAEGKSKLAFAALVNALYV